MAIGIHRSRPRCGLGGKNSAGTDRELYAIKGTSRLDREGAGRRSSPHADEDETINVRLETWLRATGIATHRSLRRIAFLYAAMSRNQSRHHSSHLRRLGRANQKQREVVMHGKPSSFIAN